MKIDYGIHIFNNNTSPDIKPKMFVREDYILKNRVRGIISAFFISTRIIASI
ncbi:MAG: hypothetical protein ACTSPQ_08400 [Candidatus Helarchaeota archaeon]